MTADLVIKGKIFTADKKCLFAQAVAVKDGKFLAVGTEEEIKGYIGKKTAIEKAKGLVIPGIVESHAHVSCATEFTKGVMLPPLCNDYHVYLEEIREYWKNHPNVKVITGSGYDNGAFGKIGPTAELLDCITKDIPIVMISSDHHSRWLNSAALELTGITNDTPNPEAGEIVRYLDGRATGWLKESAGSFTSHIIPETTAEEYAQAIAYYQEIALKNGVTAVYEPMYDAKKDYIIRAEGWRILEKEHTLKLMSRLGYSIEANDDVKRAFQNMEQISQLLSDCQKVKLSSAKFFVDGVIECHTAYLSEPYTDQPEEKGKPTCSQEWLEETALYALRHGYDLHAHVIGDGALDMALKAYIKVQNKRKEEEKDIEFRNVFTHLQIAKPCQINEMSKHQIVAVTNPYWHSKNPLYFEQVELPFIGKERAEKQYPMKSLADRNIPMGQASDFPITMPPTSMDSLHFMVNRAEPQTKNCLNEKECLDLTTALCILTIGGAYSLRLEHLIGSIEVGKKADFAFIDKDPYCLNPENLFMCQIEKTFIDGVCVYFNEGE
ncbi:MAG: amidohydrolase [Lachnospiraceae bacterium]|nr:amidohydrolase [Lachnospiraceae bacterium]